MVSKKASRSASSKISSKTALATSSATSTPNKSSILRSLFSPSKYQLSLFASVIQGPESQLIRFHDTATGRLKCKHAIKSKASITCLDWGYHCKSGRGNHDQGSNKKRKRNHQVNGLEPNASGNVVLAFGSSNSEISLLSAVEGKIVGTLKGIHTKGIKDFKFSDGRKRIEGWSLGGDAKLVQWDVEKRTSMRSIAIPGPSANAICPLGSAILCASHIAYLLDPMYDQPKTFTASNNPVQTITVSSFNSSESVSFLTATELDRFMTVFNTEKTELVGTLRPDNQIQSLVLTTVDKLSGNPLELSSNVDAMHPQEVLLVVNKEGVLEIFPSPFKWDDSQEQRDVETIKSRMKQRTRTAAGSIKIIRSDKIGTAVPLLDASFEGDNIVMAWTEGGVDLVFDRVQWRDDVNGKLLIVGMKKIVKSKDAGGFGAITMNGVKDIGRNHVDESQTIIVNGGDADDKQRALEDRGVIEISSGVEDSESEEDEDREEMDLATSANADAEMQEAQHENGVRKGDEKQISLLKADDTPMDVDGVEVEEPEGPSFGDLVRANAPKPIDVQDLFEATSEQKALAPINERGLDLPSGMSLGTVLTQALRTNDSNLLETCFTVKDLGIVRSTVERLDSSLATALLQKLAERLHSRPGRAGRLMVWVQWTLVVHGGYLANQPEVMKKIASLHRVVKERANSLQPLLSLKGKLDMLEAQMNLRRTMQSHSRALHAADEQDEEGVIYVEGQEDSESENEMSGKVSPRQIMADRIHQDYDHSSESEDDNEDQDVEDDITPAAKDFISDEASEATESEENGSVDDETSSTGESSDAAASSEAVDDSLDSGLETSSEPEAPPPKRLAKSKLTNGLVSRHS